MPHVAYDRDVTTPEPEQWVSALYRQMALRRWAKVGKRQRREIALQMVAAKRKKARKKSK